MLTNVRIIHCGTVIHTLNSTMYSSAITVLHSEDIDMNNINVIESKGTGFTILNHHEGFSHAESSLSNNTLPLDDPEYLEVTAG